MRTDVPPGAPPAEPESVGTLADTMDRVLERLAARKGGVLSDVAADLLERGERSSGGFPSPPAGTPGVTGTAR